MKNIARITTISSCIILLGSIIWLTVNYQMIEGKAPEDIIDKYIKTTPELKIKKIEVKPQKTLLGADKKTYHFQTSKNHIPGINTVVEKVDYVITIKQFLGMGWQVEHISEKHSWSSVRVCRIPTNNKNTKKP